MVLTPIDSWAATEPVILQRANCGASSVSKEGLGRDPGIVEGWRGDEDEDVNIDSDEKDSGSEGLLAAVENEQVQCAPARGSRLQLPNSGMRERTESSASPGRDEDPAHSNERAVTVNKVTSPNVAVKGNGLRVRSRKEQVGRLDGGRVSGGIRGGLSSGGSALEGGAKRLDARRFRREFNVKTDSMPARIKMAVPDAGRTRGNTRSDAKEGKKLPKEKEPVGGMADKSSPTQPHTSTTVEKGTGNVAGAYYGKGKRTFREEISKQGESVLQGNVKVRIVLGGEQFNKDNSKKRRFNDLDYAQAIERKSSLRVRGKLSKRSEDRMRRETFGYVDSGSLAKGNRARKDEEVYQVGTLVLEKETPPKPGLEKVDKSPVLSSPRAGRQNSALEKRNQRPPQANGYFQKPSAEVEISLDCLAGDGAKKSDSSAAKEIFELDSLEKVFERRLLKRKDKEMGARGNSESNRLTGQTTVALKLSDASGVVVTTIVQKTGETESGKAVDRRPTRSTDRAYGAGKAEPVGEGSQEPQKCVSKQWQEGESAALNVGLRPTRSSEKGKEGADRGHVVLETNGSSVKGTIRVLEDTNQGLTDSGTDRHLFSQGFSGSELRIAGAREIDMDQAGKMNGKRKQCLEADIENNESLSQSKGIGQKPSLEVKEVTEGEVFDVDQQAKAKKQTLSDGKGKSTPSLQGNNYRSPSLRRPDNIWHPKTPLSQSMKPTSTGVGGTQCVLMSGSTANVDPKIPTASVDVSSKKALQRQVHEGNDKGPEEGEIGSSDSDGKQVAPKSAEPVLLREAEGEIRRSIQVAIPIDELCVPEDRPTISHESIGRDQGDDLQYPSELQASYDLAGKDRSDSEDGRVSDDHNSYCQYCKQGGELLCCDGTGCKITYHLECTDPKLWEVPSGNWYCPMCAHKRLSYGVHAVSKSVESIWDVRNCAQSSDHSSLLLKNVPANDLHCCNVKDPRTTGRALEGTRGIPVQNADRVEDECIATVTVSIDDEEGTHAIAEATSGPQGITQRTDEDFSLQRLTERRQWDGDAKMLGNIKMPEGKKILGSTSRAVPGLKLLDESGDKEYFVKWRGISHAHNSWVGESELSKLSPKALARFKKRLAEGQVVQWTPEWAEPQRLVDKRISIPPRRPGGGRGRGFLGMDTQQEWFVKWKGLGYEHCTWEPVHSGILSDAKVKHLQMMFDRWSEAARQRNHPQRVEEVEKLREASFKQLQSQPEWIQFGKLLPYELDRLNLLRKRWHHHQNTIIIDQDDQEKSSATVTFLLSLIEEYGVFRLILVVVPVFEIQCWEAEFSEYAPQVNTIVYMGGKEARGVIQRFELNRSNTLLKVQVVLTTCEVAFSDFDYLRKIKWEVVVVDESQQSKTAKSHRAFLQFDAAFWLLFISELSKYNVEELQQILFLFHPQSSSSTSYVRKQLTGLSESGQLQYLKDQLSEYIVKDFRPDDASCLKLVEYWVGTNMTSLQIQLYCTTLTKHFNLLQSGRLRSDPDSPSLHDFVTQLRLGCGKEDLPPSESLIDAGVEASGKWQVIHTMLSVLHLQHHRVVILSQSLMQLFFLDDYLRQKYGPDSYELVDTRYSALRKNSAVQRFNAKDSTRSFFLLRTGASGFSLKLKDKDIVIIHDSDLNPANDLEYLRKVLHRVDGELKVFRLYQHFTVEEGSMVYDYQKKFGPDPKPLSVKILQHLLRWKVQHILELDRFYSGKIDMPREKQKAYQNDKATQDLKRVTNILRGNIEMESGTSVDEVWSEEDGDSVKEFWLSLLKDRHAELQDLEEQSNPGKGLRQRKRVQYSEEALALAPYSVPEEEEIRRKRRRPQLVESTSMSVSLDKAIHSSLQSPPATPRQADICQEEEPVKRNDLSSKFLPEVKRAARSEPEVSLSASVIDHITGEQVLERVGSDGVCEQHTQEGENFGMEQVSSKARISSMAKKVKKEELMRHAPAEVLQVIKHPKPGAAGNVSATTSQVDNGKRLRIEQKQQLLRMEPELSRIVDILQVAETVADHSQQLLSHVMNNFRMPKEPRELVVMVEISLCLIASTRFGQVVEHSPAVSRVGEKMNLALKNEEFSSVYARLESMCKTCVALPSAQPGASDKEIFLNNAVDVNASSHSTSGGTESSVELPSTSKVSDLSPITKCSLRLSGEKEACIHQNESSQNCAVSVSKQDMAFLAQDDLPRTEFEQSGQPSQAGGCEVTSFQDTDLTSQAQETAKSRNHEVISGVGQFERQPMAVSSETMQPPLLQTVGATRARLKSDRDQLLHSWLAKQKLEVQEFNASCADEKAARQKFFENQKAKILAMSVKVEQRVEMLRQLGEVFSCTLKLCEREEEDRRQVMNSTQRDLRDRINTLYTKLQQQYATGTPPDLLSEARSMGLTFSMQSQTPKLLEHGRTHTKQGHRPAVPQVEQSAHGPLSLLGQNTDLSLLPSTHTTQLPHLQHQTQPRSRGCTPTPPCNSQPRFRTQSQPEHYVHVSLPQIQLQCQLQPYLQHFEILPSSKKTSNCQPISQAISVQTTPNLDRELSTPDERVAAQLQCSHPLTRRSQSHSLQQNVQTKERSQPTRSHLNFPESLHSSLGSESRLAISAQELERAHAVAEQGSVQPPMTEHAKVSESIHPSTIRQAIVSQTSQSPTHLQPRITQIVDSPTSLQARIAQSVQASRSLLPRVPHTVINLAPQVSQAVDAPTSLQSRTSQIRRPLSIQHAAGHPTSLYHTVQPQLQPTGGQSYSISNSCSSVGASSLATQTRSNVHSQNTHLGAHSSQIVFGPDPLAHEESRLKREHEKVKLLYNEETTQIKTQYDREATELRRKYEGLLYERAGKFEHSTAALKENLEKVERNRQLAEALKLRSLLDQQKARQTLGHSTEVVSVSGQAGRLSGLTANISGRGHLHPSHQSNVVGNVGRSIGRGFSGAALSAGSENVVITDAGTPNAHRKLLIEHRT